MPTMKERIFHRRSNEVEQFSPHALAPDFDAESAFYVREMENELIRLGHMTEDERMRIPPDIEFPHREPDARNSPVDQ